MNKILVIKLGALGDFIQATGPFAAIRTAHKNAHITLLTTKPYAVLAKASPYFDEVWLDEKPKFWNFSGVLKLRNILRTGRFDMVYDLQTSDRSSFYYRLMGKKVKWSGIAKGCSHPHANPRRDFMHTIERQAEQLQMAGIAEVSPPDLSWVKEDIGKFALPLNYVLIVAGGAAHRPEKRWPYFKELAHKLEEEGLTPVFIGTKADDIPALLSPGAISLEGKTSFGEIAALGAKARLAIGNDTGPMHILAASGVHSLVLFSGASDPALCAPRGGQIRLLREDRLKDLTLERVWGEIVSISYLWCFKKDN